MKLFYRYIPIELQMKYKKIQKTKQCDDVDVFVDDFIEKISERFKPGSSYNDVSTSPAELPSESYMKILCR
jgi:hypothetical protein